MSERKLVEVGASSSGDGLKPVFHNATRYSKEGFTGQMVEGVFEGLVEEQKETAKGKKFTARSYIFVTEEGQKHYVDSFGLLDYKMKEVSPGEVCVLSYLGKDENDYHQVSVQKYE